MPELLDQISNLDLGHRGLSALFAAACERSGGSPVRAAVELLEGVPPGATVVLTTGLATRPWISTAHIESDGPPGTMVLARVLREALGLDVLLVAEAEVLPPLRRLAEWASVAARERVFPLQGAAAPARDLLRDEAPGALVSVERLGRNDRGVFHSARGHDLSQGKAAIDTLFEMATASGLPTVGIGDGGNEIGMGAIPEAVRAGVPFAERCACGCGGGIAAVTETSVLVTGGTSNWAAYAVADLLACRADRADLLHAGLDEGSLLQYGVELGLVNGMRHTVDADVDAIPLSAHRAIAELLCEAARLTPSGALPEAPPSAAH